MISRLNFTNRKRIQRATVEVTLIDDEPRRFDATLDLEDVGLPGDAEVIVEATSGGSPVVQRFDFGTVAELTPPADRRLTEITGEHVIFAVKVVDRSEHIGRLLGVVEGLRPTRPAEGESGRQCLLPVNPADLGQRLWRLNFDETDVYLEVNVRLPEIKGIVQGDDHFISLVYPEIVRQILERVVAVEGHTEKTDDDSDWRDLWLRFGLSCHPERRKPPEIPERPDNTAREELDQWLDEIVDAFSRHHRILDRFAETVEAAE